MNMCLHIYVYTYIHIYIYIYTYTVYCPQGAQSQYPPSRISPRNEQCVCIHIQIPFTIRKGLSHNIPQYIYICIYMYLCMYVYIHIPFIIYKGLYRCIIYEYTPLITRKKLIHRSPLCIYVYINIYT